MICGSSNSMSDSQFEFICFKMLVKDDDSGSYKGVLSSKMAVHFFLVLYATYISQIMEQT